MGWELRSRLPFCFFFSFNGGTMSITYVSLSTEKYYKLDLNTATRKELTLILYGNYRVNKQDEKHMHERLDYLIREESHD